VIDHDIAWFEVAINDRGLLTMQKLQDLEQLTRHVDHDGLRHATARANFV
jgi:hypothetical protein